MERPRPARADASRVLQGVRGVRAGPPAPAGRRPDRVPPRQPALPVRPPDAAGGTARTASPWPSGWPRAADRRIEQRARLRSLGDFSLFMSGFFSDSFRRRAVDVDYYVSMGEYAYGSLSRRDEDAFAEVFGELARKFVGFMDVLADVSERTALASARRSPPLREWLRTGSTRDGEN